MSAKAEAELAIMAAAANAKITLRETFIDFSPSLTAAFYLAAL
jgi:hypothetical protein